MHQVMPEPSTYAELVGHYAAVRRRLNAPMTRAPLARKICLHPLSPAQIEREQIADVVRRFRTHVESEPSVGRAALALKLSAEAFDVGTHELLARCRKPRITRIRQLAMALAYHLSGKKCCEVGRHFHRDHAAVLASNRKVGGLISELLTAAEAA